MNYTILESHFIFEKDKLKEVAVLWDDNGFVRATYSTLSPKAGYVSLTVNDTITPELLQRVAGGGCHVDEERREKYFPGERPWSR